MFLALLLLFVQTAAPTTPAHARWGAEGGTPATGYVDIHNHPQSFDIRKNCPRGQHQHTTTYSYPMFDKDHKTVPVMKLGDGKCYEDSNDKLAPKSVTK
jgi:hypothetical protein